MSSTAPKTKLPAVFMWDHSGLNVLIPKKRGLGFLRTPYGDHRIDKIEDALDEMGGVDACGLDGYLELEFGMVSNREEQVRIAGIALPALAKASGFSDWVENTNLFWDILQKKIPPESSLAFL